MTTTNFYQFFNKLGENDLLKNELKVIINNFTEDNYKKNSYDVFQKVLKRRIEYIEKQNASLPSILYTTLLTKMYHPFLNELETNDSFREELDVIIREFANDYLHYIPHMVDSYNIFKEVLKTHMSFINAIDNQNFEILSFYNIEYKKNIKRKFLFWKKIEYSSEKTVISKDDDRFNNLFFNIGDFSIYSILRKSDNTILTVGDKCYHIYGEEEGMGGFCLDGSYYIGYELKSESGVSVAFGGGTFVDIKNIKKIIHQSETERKKRSLEHIDVDPFGEEIWLEENEL